MYKSIRSPGLKKIITIAVILVALANTAGSQIIYNTSPDYYNVAMKRLLAQYVGNYINQVTQGQLNLDSATSMACQIYHINRLLPYNAGFDGDQTTQGMELINSGQLVKARDQLVSLKGDYKIRRLFELSSYYLFKPQNDKSDLDSAKSYNDMAYSLVRLAGSTKWINICDDMYGKYYAKAGDMQKSQAYFQKLVKAATVNKDEPALAVALYTKASFLPFNSPDKLKILQKTLLLSQKLKLNILEFQALTDIFTLHFMVSNKMIDEEIVQILKIEKAIGFRHQQYTYNVYAYMAMTKADFISSLEYARQSIKYMQETGDNALSSVFYQRMGEAMTFLSEYDQALAWHQKAVNGLKTKQTQIFWYQSFIDETHVLFDLRRYEETLTLIKSITRKFPPESSLDQLNVYYSTGHSYYGLKDYSKAETQLQNFVQIADHYPIQYIHNILPDGYIVLATIYCKEGKFKLAKVYLQKTEALNLIFKSVITKMNLYDASFKLDSATGKNVAAIKDYQSYKIMFDSINNTKVRQEYDQLKIQFETVNKDRNIKILKQANELQNTKLKQDTYFRKMTVGAIALVTIIAGLLYYLYRSKQRSNVKLQSQQKVLENLITEKEWLVKEIHHRVKNNLHTIVSLLESQSAYLHNDDALAAVKDSQHRVHAMSLIHQKLYMGDNMTSIRSADYIKELVNYLKDSFSLNNTIMFQIDVEQIDLDVSQAIPLGLIINEAITNSIKYAFNKPGGKITIKLLEISGSYLLKIEDNGVGLPKNFNVNDRTKSLGMSLINGLTREIAGHFDIFGDNGTSISILFPPYEVLYNPSESGGNH